MTPHCHNILELLAAEIGAGCPWSASLESHLQDCGECAATAKRMQACTELVSALEPVGAPADLEGRVVSACQVGFAEARAADGLKDLGALEAPAALDSRMGMVFTELREEGIFGKRVAPAVLEERVESDLDDLPQTISRQFIGKLPRQEAPSELRERVEGDLEPVYTNKPGLRILRGAGPLVLVAAAAAAGVLLVATLQQTPGHNAQAPEPLVLSFDVVHPVDFEGLSPRARDLAARVTGGLDPALLSLSRVAVETDEGFGLGAQRRAAAGSPAGPATANPATAGTGGGSSSYTIGGGTGGSTSAPGTSQAPLGSGSLTGPTYFAGISGAPFQVAYRGTREVTIRMRIIDMVSEVLYVEEVASDGNGAFTVLPLNVISPVMGMGEENEYLMRQESREGFFYRHRDFRIREDSPFMLNYEVHDLALAQTVAGRACETFRVQRKDGTGNIYEVAIDPLTSLVMKELCSTQSGELVSQAEFQSFQLAADLSDLQLNSGVSSWTPVDQAGLSAVLAHTALNPVAPPSGYELQELGYRTAPDGSGTHWVQYIYGDGVEQAFFLFEDSLGGQGNTGPQAGIGHSVSDVVRSYSFGPWNMVEGRLAGRYVLSVGRVSEAQLFLMLQSAIE